MAAKKVRELVFEDLDRPVVLANPEGDRVSGQLKFIGFTVGYLGIRIDNTELGSLDPDAVIEFTD